MPGEPKAGLKEFTILLLGMTGSGKSAYINSIANYLSYKTLKEAIKGSEPVCVIPTKFSQNIILPDKSFKRLDIEIDGRNAEDVKNEGSGSGASATQHPRSYSFVQNDAKINIIDVPGVCDTRGPEVDKKNKQLIINKIQQFSEIHAIWIVLKAVENRSTIEFLFGLNDIFCVVPRQAVENISFVITYSKIAEFTPGDTMEPLAEFVGDLNKKRDLNIDLKKTIFCVDNESYRIQIGWHKNNELRNFIENKIDSYEASWKESRNSTMKLLEKTLRATAKPTSTFLTINNARIAILCFLHTAGRILITIEQNKSPAFREKLKSGLINGNELQNDIEVKKMQHPKTVCTGQYCISWSLRPDGKKNFEFKVCHDNCYLKDAIYGKMPQEALKNCQIFDIHNNCKNCGCNFAVHTNILFRYQNVTTSKRINRMTDAQAEAWINNYIKSLENMKSAIFNAFIAAYSYLHQNAILTFNDSFEEQMNNQIRLLEIAENEDEELINNLRKSVENHRKIVATAKQLSRNQLNGRKVTDEEFFSTLNNVFNMKPLGNTIKQLYDSEQQTATEYNIDFEPLEVKFVPRV